MKYLPFIFLFFSICLESQTIDYYVKVVPCDKNMGKEEVRKTDPNGVVRPQRRVNPRSRMRGQSFDISSYLSESAHSFSMDYLSYIDKVPRIKLVDKNESDQFPITHVLETCTLLELVNKGITVKRFVDSTKMVHYETMVKVSAKANILLKEVSTGKILRSKEIKRFEEIKQPHKLTYKAFSKKGAKPSKGQVIEEAKRGYEGMVKKAVTTIKKDFKGAGRGAEYHLFPYKLKVIEASEIKKDQAKKIMIEYDSKYGDIYNQGGSIFYNYQTDINGETKIVYANIAKGIVSYTNKEKTAFTFIVGFKSDEQAVFKALNEGKELFFSLGPTNFGTDKPERLKIALGNIKAPSYFQESAIEELYFDIQSQMTQRGDLEVLDRASFADILKIKENNKSEAFLDKKIADQFSAAGADYLMEVIFDEPVLSGNMPENFMQTWSIKFAYESRLYDVKTGELVFNEEEYSGSSVKVKYTKKPPYRSAGTKVGDVRFEVKEFFDYALPRELKVHKVLSEKKGKVKTLKMYGIFKVVKNEKFLVNEVIEREVDGKTLIQHKEIGKISLDGRLNSFIIKATVKKGGKEIFQAIQEGKKLFFTSRPNWIERWDNRVEAKTRRKAGGVY